MSNHYCRKKELLLLIVGMIICAPVEAAPITWVAQGSNDMEMTSNWNPNTVPTVGDDAIFDSTFPGVNTNPLEQTLDFSCASFQFPQSASLFNITIANHQLIFNGAGIVGNQTNTTINSTNNDTPYTVNNQILFNGISSTSGSANLLLINSSNITGAGSNTFQSVIDRQIYSPNPFFMNDNGNINATNTGSDSSSGSGGDISAGVFQGQAIFGNTCTIGDHASISISNNGINTSSSSGSNQVGYVLERQLYVGNNFQAGSFFNLNATNTGIDSSTGAGGQLVGVVLSAASAGLQVEMAQACTVGDQATISVTNSGTYNGTNTAGGPGVAATNQEQARFRGAFNAGDSLSLAVSNTSFDNGQGIGNDRIATVGAAQLHFDSSCTIGNHAQIDLLNLGFYTATTTVLGNIIGVVNNEQILVEGAFQAGDSFNLDITNLGVDFGVSAGTTLVGALTNAAQAQFRDTLTVANDAIINIQNIGLFAGSGSGSDAVGYVQGEQLCLEGIVNAGNNFELKVSNVGIVNTTGTGNTSGVVQGQQLCFGDSLTVGNNFNLEVSNTGIIDTTGLGNGAGRIAASQVQFNNGCSLGEDARILVINSGSNNNAIGTSSFSGTVTGSQVFVIGDFTAGKNLDFSVSNSANNAGDLSNSVGVIDDSQIIFNGACTLDANSFLFASNSGTVSGSQISLTEGFNILSGKATIHTRNTGSVSSNGIVVQGNSLGGNANIILENSSLYIDTNFPIFTIGELNGDATSTVQSLPLLIINTDSLTNALFAGSIQNFSATNSTLSKQGAGTQKLSGVNTFTGLTSIKEGSLVLTGSLAGGVIINPLGILKGTGTIGGNVINLGTIAPGESIGTLTILGNYANNNGTYDVEINGLGQSDLIDIAGAATLNGGEVVVSSTDGTFRFQQPYTILTAEGGVSGVFTRATSIPFINPILTYDPNHVFLTIQSAITRAAESCNQVGVAQNLDSIINPNTPQSLLLSAIVNLPLEVAQEALESLSGYQYTCDVWVTEIATRRFLRRLYDPLRSIVSSPCDCFDPCYDPCCGWTGWLEMGEGFTSLKGNSHAHALHMNSFEITGGIQKSFCCDLTSGLAGSYEYDHVKYSRGGGGNRHTGFLALYGLYRPCLFYGLVDFVYGHTSNSLSRAIQVGSLHYTARSKPNLSQFTFYGEVGFDWNAGSFLVQPFLGIQSGKNRREHVKESNANGWGLVVNQHHRSTTSSRFGLHVTTKNFCNCIELAADIAWNQLLSSRKNSGNGRFREFGHSFHICGDSIDRSSIDYVLRFTSCPCDCMKAFVELGGETWKHANNFDVLGRIEFNW